ncbi:unnamed protein product [Prunus brigantina]
MASPLESSSPIPSIPTRIPILPFRTLIRPKPTLLLRFKTSVAWCRSSSSVRIICLGVLCLPQFFVATSFLDLLMAPSLVRCHFYRIDHSILAYESWYEKDRNLLIGSIQHSRGSHSVSCWRFFVRRSVAQT